MAVMLKLVPKVISLSFWRLEVFKSFPEFLTHL